MNAADRQLLTALADTAARCLDVPRPLVAPTPVSAPDDFEAWFTAYKRNDAAYESLVRERTLRVESALRSLALSDFSEIRVMAITEGLAEELAEPLPYEVQS